MISDDRRSFVVLYNSDPLLRAEPLRGLHHATRERFIVDKREIDIMTGPAETLPVSLSPLFPESILFLLVIQGWLYIYIYVHPIRDLSPFLSQYETIVKLYPSPSIGSLANLRTSASVIYSPMQFLHFLSNSEDFRNPEVERNLSQNN